MKIVCQQFSKTLIFLKYIKIKITSADSKKCQLFKKIKIFKFQHIFPSFVKAMDPLLFIKNWKLLRLNNFKLLIFVNKDRKEQRCFILCNCIYNCVYKHDIVIFAFM